MAKSDIDKVGIKLQLLDLVEPYGVTGTELTPIYGGNLSYIRAPLTGEG